MTLKMSLFKNGDGSKFAIIIGIASENKQE